MAYFCDHSRGRRRHYDEDVYFSNSRVISASLKAQIGNLKAEITYGTSIMVAEHDCWTQTTRGSAPSTALDAIGPEP